MQLVELELLHNLRRRPCLLHHHGQPSAHRHRLHAWRGRACVRCLRLRLRRRPPGLLRLLLLLWRVLWQVRGVLRWRRRL
jgi:hypothetical protein